MFSSVTISVSSHPPSLFLSRYFPFAYPACLSSALYLYLLLSPYSSEFFVERLSRRELADAARTTLTFTGVYARGLKPHVSRGLHDNVIASGEVSHVRRLKTFLRARSLLSHIYYSAFPDSSFLSLFLSSPYNLGHRSKFIHSPTNPVTAYFTCREGGSHKRGIFLPLSVCLSLSLSAPLTFF